MSHPPYLPMLVASIHSLRRYYFGEVVVYTFPETTEMCEILENDIRLNVTCKPWEPAFKGKNDQFANKILVMSQIDADVGLYLDADTVVSGNLDPLFSVASQKGFVATQFCTWSTNSKLIRNRIKRLRGIEEVNQRLVEHLLLCVYPSVNGGVFACRPESDVLPLWYSWTHAARKIFIADETVLHILQAKFPKDEFEVALSFWNVSPKHQTSDVDDRFVRVWHGHGQSFIRPQKSKRAVGMWVPVWRECLNHNIGNCQDWWQDCNNKYLNELMRSPYLEECNA